MAANTPLPSVPQRVHLTRLLLGLRTLREGVASLAPFVRQGELIDPVFGEPTQYASAYHALAHLLLSQCTAGSDSSRHRAAGLDSMEAALSHVEDRTRAANASGMDARTGQVWAHNHRDFFWPALLKCHDLLSTANDPAVHPLWQRIKQIDLLAVVERLPPSNWAAVWLSGEYRRHRASQRQAPTGDAASGLPSFTDASLGGATPEQIDRWLQRFFDTHISLEHGFFHEPGHSNSYDLFTRLHLLDMLHSGYNGAHAEPMRRLLVNGTVRSLAVQLSSGSLASAHRSTGQTWTLGAQALYFTRARRLLERTHPDLAYACIAASCRAVRAMSLWQRPDGPYSPVENLLPPAMRIGYEVYSGDAHYSMLALAMLAEGVHELLRLDGGTDAGLPELPADALPAFTDELDRWVDARPPQTWIENDPVYRAVLHRGPYSLQVNAWPHPAYDAWGVTDLTVGAGRRLHLGPSVKVADRTDHITIGGTVRSQPGRSPLLGGSPHERRLIGPIQPGATDASATLCFRQHGDAAVTHWQGFIDEHGVHIVERRPLCDLPATFVLPYLLDAGANQRTTLNIDHSHEPRQTHITLRHGAEALHIAVSGHPEHVTHLTHGFENRRGLCALLRLDLDQTAAELRYSVARQEQLPEHSKGS